MTIGKVILAGAGPGDPELLTLKAYKAIQNAQVIVYDYLISEEIKALFPTQSRIIYVGKKHGNHSVSQAEINQLLIDQALLGNQVVRLKGGDPFIFGRGAEEIEALLPHHIPFEIIPGITAASGCTTYAGIPLTHRNIAKGVQFVTGHSQENGTEPNWKALAQYNGTLIFYMGLHKSQYIQQRLLECGMDRLTSIAIIENGTKKTQKTHIGCLENLVQLSKESASPSLIVMGDVVSLSKKFSWF